MKKITLSFPFLEKFSDVFEHGFYIDRFPDVSSDIPKYSHVLQVPKRETISMKQVHGSDVITMDEQPVVPLVGDGLITARRGLFLEIVVADCAPVYLLDPVRRAIGLLHCGWRPIANGILENAVRRMYDEFGVLPDNLRAFVGPCIGNDDYEVGFELTEFFHSQSFHRKGDSIFLDISGEIIHRLGDLGLHNNNIEKFPVSTYADEALCSFRRDKNDLRRMSAYLGIR